MKAAFLERFSKYGLHAFRDKQELWKLRQKSNQTVGEFITEVRSLADIIGVDSEATFDVILAGLKPHIQSFLLTKQVRTLEELIRQSRLAKVLLSTSDSSNADLMAAMKEIQARLDRMDVVRSVSPGGSQ